MSIPNIITLFRLFLVPIVVWAIAADEMWIACLAFVVAGVSDGIDGFIARHFNQRTELGAYLDPIADKALLVSIYVTLGMFGHIPRWLVILVVSRDLMIVGAVMLSWLMDKPVTIAPLMVSKVNTTMQIVFAAAVLGSHGFAIDLGIARTTLMWAVAALTLASAAAYLAEWMRHMAEDPPQRPD